MDARIRVFQRTLWRVTGRPHHDFGFGWTSVAKLDSDYSWSTGCGNFLLFQRLHFFGFIYFWRYVRIPCLHVPFLMPNVQGGLYMSIQS